MGSFVSHYKTNKWAYCKNCAEWRFFSELKKDRSGAYRCYVCGYRVRLRSRRSRKKNRQSREG